MSENDNKTIHEWLGKCWHEFRNDCVCQKPNCCADNSFRNQNPDYFTSYEAMGELLEALRAKGLAYELYGDSIRCRADIFSAFSRIAGQKFIAETDTLPAAVASATLKLIGGQE